MKKHINILIAFTLLLLGTASCTDNLEVGDSFLDKAQGEDVNENLIFSKKVYTDYLLWECYDGLYSPFKACYTLNSGIMECLSDLMHSELGWDDIGRMYYTGNLTAANANPGWCQSRFAFITQNGLANTDPNAKKSIWECVRDCWLLIDNIDRVPDMTEAEKARYKAEAKIIIAIKYFDGIRHFGGLPIIDHAFKGTDQLQEGRATIEETVDFANNLLNEAIAEPNLPWNIPDNELATWSGRMTKASAVGMKIKLWDYAASPIFNNDKPYCTESPQDAVDKRQVWYGNYDPARWDSVIVACKQFFEMNQQNGNYYHLVQPETQDEDGFRAAFRKAYRARGNHETLVEVHDRVYMKDWDLQALNGCMPATLDWMEMFPWSDGKNFDGQKYYNQAPAEKDIFENRDPRLYESMVVQKRNYKYQINNEDNPVQMWVGGEFNADENKNTWANKPWGFPTFKWVLDEGDVDHDNEGLIDKEPMSVNYLRLADIYLIYAEALTERGQNAEALKNINIVRRRVGLGDIEKMNPELNLTSDKDALIDQIMRERACELGAECENRFHDMNRRLMVKDFTKHLRGLNIYRLDDHNQRVLEPWSKGSGDPFPTKFEYEPFDIEGANPRFVWDHPERWSNKWILAPLPPDEINKNYGLTQNPGWN